LNKTTLVAKQHDDPKEDPFTNLHLLINRFQALKDEQNYFGQQKILEALQNQQFPLKKISLGKMAVIRNFFS
jgi:Fe-S-cluster formation regulator IscX/YfhJ